MKSLAILAENGERIGTSGKSDAASELGAAILDGVERPASGRVVASHLGTGLADLVFGRAIVRSAEVAGRGTILPR